MPLMPVQNFKVLIFLKLSQASVVMLFKIAQA